MTRSARDAVRDIYVNRRRVRRKEERQPALREGHPITSFDTACVNRLLEVPQEKPTTCCTYMFLVPADQTSPPRSSLRISPATRSTRAERIYCLSYDSQQITAAPRAGPPSCSSSPVAPASASPGAPPPRRRRCCRLRPRSRPAPRRRRRRQPCRPVRGWRAPRREVCEEIAMEGGRGREREEGPLSKPALRDQVRKASASNPA